MKKRITITLIIVLVLLIAIFLTFVIDRLGPCSLKNAQRIKEGMSVKEVIFIVGPDWESVGSGFIIWEWEIDNGQYLLVWLSNPETNSGKFDTVVSHAEISDRSLK